MILSLLVIASVKLVMYAYYVNDLNVWHILTLFCMISGSSYGVSLLKLDFSIILFLEEDEKTYFPGREGCV